MMNNAFEILGLKPWAGPEEIHAAYRALAKQCHPDGVQDPEEKKTAQQRMVQLNLAYEEALRLASPRGRVPVTGEVCGEDAIRMAESMLEKGKPENALRQLLRAEDRDARWHFTQGKVLMRMEQYESAHQSLREAIRRDPENREYRALALDAAVAQRKAQSPLGKVKKIWKQLKNK